MMKNKFRGVDVVTKKYVYGKSSNLFGLPTIEIANGHVLVKEGTIAQKVGVDKNGREVYEGDKVKNPVDGTTFKAAMNHINTIKAYELCRDKI
ncbi:MAG: hypothetical protein IJK81_00535 [Selenomonadaceae bacterium]|nr:hypothetical protein [Selenomonadaceae bacterium]